MTDDRMTNAEAVVLCRFAKACCPQQQFDSFTPDAWFELLRDLRFEDCKEALTRLVKKQPFVSPAEIRDMVKKVRWERIEAFHAECHVNPPAELADDPRAEIEWWKAIRQRVADGEITHPSQVEPDAGLVVAHDVIAELGLVGKEVPRA